MGMSREDISFNVDQLYPSRKADSQSTVSGIILAGGKSRRMGGVNKALLEIGKLRIVERVRQRLALVIPDVIIITNTPEEFQFLGLPMFGDLVPGHGSLGGLYTGLTQCSGRYGFLVGCDLPFLDERVIAHMVGLIGDCDVVIPRIRGKLEPLHAIYSRTCLPYIEKLMQDGDLKILNMFHKVKLREVPQKDLEAFDPEFRFVININTPDDLIKARKLAGIIQNNKG